MRSHIFLNPIVILVGLAFVLLALVVLAAAARQLGQGSCCTGCCLAEIGESLGELGCGLLGCGGTLVLLLVPLLGWFGFLHR